MRAFLLVVLLLAIAAATLGFVTDRARAQPLVAPPAADAGTEPILPPVAPRPDGGLVPDAGGPMTP
jgi:hypothetical protein